MTGIQAKLPTAGLWLALSSFTSTHPRSLRADVVVLFFTTRTLS